MPESYDGRIDWREWYSARVERAKVSGGKITGLCPFHENTRTPAWWASAETGLWKCEGCGKQGNPTSFLAELDGITTKEANARLLEMAGVAPRERKAKAASVAPEEPYTVEVYAAEKGLAVEDLKDWGAVSKRHGRGSWVALPYRDVSGEVTATRRRFPPSHDPRFQWSKGDKLSLYGLWFLPTWGEDVTDVALVEGESDCHALWSLGIPALGVPGAGTFRAEWAAHLVGRRVLIHSEGDDGALLFCDRVSSALAAAGHDGGCAVWSTPGDVKDPSALYLAHGADSGTMLAEAMRAAVPLDLDALALALGPRDILTARGLTCPAGWHCDASGVWGLNEEGESWLVTPTPIVLSQRIIDAQGAGERVEVAFLRDGKWTTCVADRDEAFSTRSIVGLMAPLGAAVTSENARHVVRWLGALEAQNMDALPTSKASSQFGWCGEAFLPTHAGDVVLDSDDAGAELVAAFEPRGTLQGWREAVGPHRDASPVLRFLVAAGVAAPLLRAVNGRIFFVYNWGSSKGGKTAALKAALSAWGDPTLLMTTFNATSVGLERMASLMRDLPLGIDERQMAGGDQKRLDQIVYTLASGTGRVRGARDGGLQTTLHWRCVVIATGEEPLGGSTSMTGVSTRVLEVFGSPFTSEAEAAAMHDAASEHYGHAGRVVIDALLRDSEDATRALVARLRERIEPGAAQMASSHVAGLSVVAAADVMLSREVFGVSEDEAIGDALMMVATVLAHMEGAEAGDSDEAVRQWVAGWIRSNEARFASQSFGPVYGESADDVYHVLTTVLREALESAGWSWRKAIKALQERGAVVGDANRVQRVHGKPCRATSIDVSVIVGASTQTSMMTGRPF